MFNLILKEYTNEKIVIQAMPDTPCTEFTWKGYTSNQTFENIETTKKPFLTTNAPSEFLKKYTQVLCYASDDKESYISPYLFLNIEVKSMDILAVKSVKGFSLFFMNQILTTEKNPLCDEYKLYGTKGDKTRCVVTSDKFVTHVANLNYDSYYAEGYKKSTVDDVDTYILAYKTRIINVADLIESCDLRLGEYDAMNVMHSDLAVCIPITSDCESDITRAIDSVLASNGCRISVILVNNLYNENLQKICKWYASHYPNVIYKDNYESDYGAFRNFIIMTARTSVQPSYITFLDQDEFVHPLAYKKMVAYAKSWNDDIVFAKYITYDSFECGATINSDAPEYINNAAPHSDFIMADDTHIANWHHIVKTNIMTKCPFPERTEYPNDVPTMNANLSQALCCIAIAKSFAICNDAIYGCEEDMYECGENFNLENILFTDIAYPKNKMKSEQNVDANVFILKRFVFKTLPSMISENTSELDMAKIGLIIRHIKDDTILAGNPLYEKDEQLQKRLKIILRGTKESAQKAFLWAIQNEYLEVNIKKA